MAEFRKILNATAMVTLLAGLSAPAFAQATCNAGSVLPPDMRQEGHAELVGEILVRCTGGVSTPPGQDVPSVNIRVQLSTFITSALSVTGGLDNEVLLIVDEPNSGRYAPNSMAPNATGERGLLACGQTGAPDTSASGRNTCRIVAPNHASRTYDGRANGWSTLAGDDVTTTTCDGAGGRPGPGTYGCGRPNIFQGHYLASGAQNIVEFDGVPFDPPGNIEFNDGLTQPNPNRVPWVRTFRIVNLRVDAAATSGPSVFANLSFSGNVQASVNNAENILVARNRFPAFLNPVVGGTNSFVQCIEKFIADQPLTGIRNTARSLNLAASVPFIRFTEGFQEAWKTQDWSQIQANSDASVSGRYNNYDEGFTIPAVRVRQNIPGAIFHTESGFTAAPSANEPTGPNPPVSIGFQAPGLGAQSISNSTGIASAGQATSGTRLQILFDAIPTGVTLYTPRVVYLTRSGTDVVTGIAILNTNLPSDQRNGPFSGASGPTTWVVVPSTRLAVYEMFYVDPFTEEDMTVPIGISTNLLELPQSITADTTVRGGLAPIVQTPGEQHIPLLTSNAWGNLPRFTENLQGGNTLFTLDKCNCNLLFPFVSNQQHFDTGIAIANTSKDPANGSISLAGPADRDTTGTYRNTLAQDGGIRLWYFGKNAGTTVIFTQSTGATQVEAGTVATFTLTNSTNGLGAIQTAANNSTGVGYSDFAGYMIAKASFQYCHGFAFFSNKGLANVTGLQGMSVGYLALVMDPERQQITLPLFGTIPVLNPNGRTNNTVSDGLDN